MQELEEILALAAGMLQSDHCDKNDYDKAVSYVIKHQSGLGDNAEFKSLKKTLDKIAQKFNLPTVEWQQENFGLNSCAQ